MSTTLYQQAGKLMKEEIERYLNLSKLTDGFTQVKAEHFKDEGDLRMLAAGIGITDPNYSITPEALLQERARRSAIPFDAELAVTAGVYRALRPFAGELFDQASALTRDFTDFSAATPHQNPAILPVLQHVAGIFSKATLAREIGAVSDTGISRPAAERLSALLTGRVHSSTVNRAQVLRSLDSTAEGIVRDLVGRVLLEPVRHFEPGGASLTYHKEESAPMETATRKPYPTDVGDEEWAFVAPYLALMKEDAPQRVYPLREVFNGLRWFVRAGSDWRLMPHDLPPWHTVYEQARRWERAGVFEAIVHDLRRVLRLAEGRDPEPTAAILDSRTLQSSPESGGRAGYDGYKRRRGSKVHLAVDTLGHLLALLVTPADEQDRAQVAALAEAVQEATGAHVEVAFVDQGSTGEQAAADAAAHGMRLEVVKLPAAKRGFVLLPRRWVVERSHAWLARFRRLARDYERLPETLRGLHFLAFALLLLTRFVALLTKSA